MKKIVLCITCIMALVLSGSSVAKADWDPGNGHKMHFPQLPDEVGWDVNATGNGELFPPLVLADDWMCSESGWVKDIHFWGSWREGMTGEILGFILSIHADIPADPPLIPYSRPGITLWERYVEFPDFSIRGPIPSPGQGWYDPSGGYYLHPDHLEYFQYNVFLDEADWYWQEEGTIYWLNITAIVGDPVNTMWGWKSSTEHWNDDAVWAFFDGLYNWIDIWEPPSFLQSLDLSFVITGGEAPIGACCYPEPTGGNTLCIETTLADCVNNLLGVYQGDGTICLGWEACCLPDGTCVMADALCCVNELGGSPQGQGSVCTAPDGCCFSDGTCADLDPLCCIDQGGTPQGTACSGTTIACCLPGGGCTDVDPVCCDDLGGTPSFTSPICLGDNNGNGTDDACEEELILKWEQLPDLDTTGMDVFAQLVPEPGVVLASDFLCLTTGPILEIHVWGSWLDDVYPDGDPGNTSFILSLHSDIPDPDGIGPEYSKPGELLWMREFLPGQFEFLPYAELLQEGFYFPDTGYYYFPGDTVCWEYTFYLEPDEFLQGGTELEPIVYWLDVQALPYQEAYFGWKTTPLQSQWNDDSVWGIGMDPPTTWFELRYPYEYQHPWEGESLDLAFAIYGGEEIPDTCYEYWSKLQCCNDMVAAGREIDYNVCKSYTVETTCESNGCTWHPDGNPAGSCMLDVCLMEVSGDDKVTAPDYSVFKKEFGRSGCPCVPAPGDDLCDKYACLYDYCIALNSAGQELDYDVCKSYTDQTTCESNGCTWHPDGNPAGNCMLDICLTEVSGDDKVTAPDYSVFKKEFGRSGCPCAMP